MGQEGQKLLWLRLFILKLLNWDLNPALPALCCFSCRQLLQVLFVTFQNFWSFKSAKLLSLQMSQKETYATGYAEAHTILCL